MRRNQALIRLLLALCFAASLAAQSAPSDLLLILDASGSMWGQVEGKNKIVIAREVLADLTQKLPEGIDVGLIAYGHRREGDCADIETIAPLGALDKAGLVSKVNAINPKGKTPITASIEQAVAAVRAHGRATTIVLLTDGIETCGGDPCAAVAKAKQSGANFLLHVVGFDLSKENVADLECAAQAGGGLYFDARNAQELGLALDQAVAAPEQLADSAISIKAVRNGQLTDVAIQVTDLDGGRVASGRTYAGERTNPRVMPVPAGKYNITVKVLGLKGAVERKFKDVAVAKGETVEKLVDFTSGKIAVKVTRNGALSDATIKLYADGSRSSVAVGRTYRRANSNPKVLELTPGFYDVEVGSVEISGRPERRWQHVEILPGETVELEHEFSSGQLTVGAARGGALVDAVVRIEEAGKTGRVAGGRTYARASSNPKAFTLLPGRYTVTVSPVKLKDAPKQTKQVEVPAAGSAQLSFEF